jgi:hypothetical protein
MHWRKRLTADEGEAFAMQAAAGGSEQGGNLCRTVHLNPPDAGR